MDERGELRERLVYFVKSKFWSRTDISDYAEDIVDEAFLSLLAKKDFAKDKENFGYLSVVCIRIAFKYFKKADINIKHRTPLDECLQFIGEDDFVEDILHNDDVSKVLESLDVLKEIEKIIVKQRYYGSFTFAEIAEKNGIKLNTVLSHHRRALEKLRPVLTRYFGYEENEIIEKCSKKDGYFTKFL